MKQPLDKFTLAYIECALWSSNDESDEQGGAPLDKNYSIEDFAPETLEKIIADCERFQSENGEHINAADVQSRYTNSEMAGHDFWLTRNGHGAGFWDGDWSEPSAESLTKAAESFGEFNLYIGDGGKIYA